LTADQLGQHLDDGIGEQRLGRLPSAIDLVE
jgi:hypothetical protein